MLRAVPRPARPAETAFVLPSGGSTGAAQVGILRSLLEAGIVPDLLVGSSVGALNAAFLAADPTLAQVDRLAEIWQALSRHDVFGRNRSYTLARLVLRHDHIYTPGPLRTLIGRFCPVDRLEDAPVGLQVVTTDLDFGVARWWGRGPAAQILYAGACLPGLFPPAVLDGHRHVDGGVLEPVPVGRALDLDASTVYVLGEPSGPERRSGRPNALEVLIRSFDISRYARLPDAAAMSRPGQRVIAVPGAPTGHIPITNFDQTRRLIADSHDISRDFLRRTGLAGPGIGGRNGGLAPSWPSQTRRSPPSTAVR